MATLERVDFNYILSMCIKNLWGVIDQMTKFTYSSCLIVMENLSKQIKKSI